jgi:hypothetical protein
MTAVDLDNQRRRWGDARRLDRLDPEVSDGFATGGLGAHVEALDVRVRFLTGDPLLTPVRLDTDAAEWLSNPRPAPYGNREPQLGGSRRATSFALVRYDCYHDDQGWRRFVGVHRDGSLGFGEGSSISEYRGTRFVRLRPLVGLVWHLAVMQAEAAERWSIQGPFEVSVALANVGGARLGDFAEGWRDIGDMFLEDAPRCVETHLLFRIECDTIEPESLAFDVGERLENSFGSTIRRFIANRGEFESRFDPRFG